MKEQLFWAPTIYQVFLEAAAAMASNREPDGPQLSILISWDELFQNT